MTGYAFATALAAPVEDGMMLAEAARPARQSLPFIELSTTIWDAVAAWTVVIRPCLMPNFSLMTFTIGARPLVVHEAQETTFISVLYSSWLTPMTIVGVSASLAGAEMITFFAPPSTCFKQPSVVVKAPVDSQTYSTPVLLHGISVGSRVAERVTSIPLILRPPSVNSTVPSKRPWTVSCSSWYFIYSGDIGELICLMTKSSRSIAMRMTWRPMRPKPLIPSLIGASGFVDLTDTWPRNGAGRPNCEVGKATRLSAALVSWRVDGKRDRATIPPTRRPAPTPSAMPVLKERPPLVSEGNWEYMAQIKEGHDLWS